MMLKPSLAHVQCGVARRGLLLLAALLLFTRGPAVAADAGPPEKVRFNEQIRPILSDRCFACHGPDEKQRTAELRLDTFAGATADLGGRAAIVPGQPDQSELLARIVEADLGALMPPPRSKKPRLSAREIALLRRWIEQGAEYEGHWSFLPLRDEPPPPVNDPAWPVNDIDRFILARLDREKVRPSPAADRSTLIRRVWLDLLGLLPAPDDVQQFLNDPHPLAYERLVDRLLASPHYGERWGRHWLDQARYADSNGYTNDADREMWPYRDWVIQALNADQPFDRFTIEQLAGDLLPNATKSQLVASAYHRNTLINTEGGTDREQFRVESVMDRLNTTGAVWLGLTVGCAQCHSHKFDPISHREYYEMLAFFNSTEDVNNTGPTVPVIRGEMFGTPVPTKPPDPPPLNAAEVAALREAWESQIRTRLEQPASDGNLPEKWLPAVFSAFETGSKAALRHLDDGSLLNSGSFAPHETYRVQVDAPPARIAAIRLRALTHDDLPKRGPGTAGHGNFVLTKLEFQVGDDKQHLVRAWADHEQPGYPATGVIDNDPATGWAINVAPNSPAKLNDDHWAVLVLEQPVETAGRPVRIGLLHEANAGYLVGRFAIDFSETVPPAPANATDALLLAALNVPSEQRTPPQKKLLQDAFERAEPRARPVPKRADPNLAQLMVMRELPQPRDTYVLTRGDFTRPDKERGKLAPGMLRAVAPELPPATEQAPRRTRLDLAQWLMHPDNPLTPRVTMNRLWMRYFGRGLVETDEDFGAQGAPPSHPALLDWLGREFQRRGMRLKQMHRLIVTSATYRQASRPRLDLQDKDPRNLWLARQERVRLEGEIVRDAALSASGLLTHTLGGPSVHPPQPDGVYSFTQVAKRWETDAGADRYRRAMYTFFYRSAPYPLFTTFDAPDFQSVCTRRLRSNTPLQSLTLANDPAFLEMARGLAARLLRDLPGDGPERLEARITHACVLCLSRPPMPSEQSLLKSYTMEQQSAFTADPAAALQLATPALADKIPAPEAAALVCLARILLNTDNFIMRE